MKLIPQIHVFVINIQCKILLGIMLMMILCPSHGRIYGPVYRGHDDGGPEAAYDVWVTGSGHSPVDVK